MLTVGQLNEKISVLRSKIAVTEGTVLHLKTHYMPSEGADPENRFQRDDHGIVPPSHVEATIADYVEYLDALRIELQQLEETPIASSPETVKIVATSETLPEEEPAKDQTAMAGEKPAQEPPKTKPKVVAVKPNGNQKPSPPAKEPEGAAQRRSEDQPATPRPFVAGKTG